MVMVLLDYPYYVTSATEYGFNGHSWLSVNALVSDASGADPITGRALRGRLVLPFVPSE